VTLFGGLGAFALVALLVLYAYHKGQLNKNQNGVPDLLEPKSSPPLSKLAKPFAAGPPRSKRESALGKKPPSPSAWHHCALEILLRSLAL